MAFTVNSTTAVILRIGELSFTALIDAGVDDNYVSRRLRSQVAFLEAAQIANVSRRKLPFSGREYPHNMHFLCKVKLFWGEQSIIMAFYPAPLHSKYDVILGTGSATMLQFLRRNVFERLPVARPFGPVSRRDIVYFGSARKMAVLNYDCPISMVSQSFATEWDFLQNTTWEACNVQLHPYGLPSVPVTAIALTRFNIIKDRAPVSVEFLVVPFDLPTDVILGRKALLTLSLPEQFHVFPVGNTSHLKPHEFSLETVGRRTETHYFMSDRMYNHLQISDSDHVPCVKCLFRN